MRITLNTRILGAIGLLTMFIVGIVGVTTWVTTSQKADAVVINLAGRQRMLTQKMTKAILGYTIELQRTAKEQLDKNAETASTSQSTAVRKEEVHEAEAVKAQMLFSKTLAALLDGGPAPFGAEVPILPRCKNEAIRTQLNVVAKMWESFSSSMDLVLSKDTRKDEEYRSAINVIFTQNNKLLSEMNKAVGMFQTDSEGRTVLMRNIQYCALGLTVLVFGFATFYIRTHVTGPINRIIENINDGANQVSEASEHVSSSSQVLAEGATEQAAFLEETSGALKEVATMTRNNTKNSKIASDLSGQTRTAAEKGNQTVAQLNVAMSAINNSSEQISKIINVIEEIAFQTNLLALNAAVEAARAGEHGKGFAVVADEVRGLAQRAAEAVRDTTRLIEDSVNKAREGTEVATNVGAALGTIVGNVTKVATLIDGISTASEEQAQGVDQVNAAVSRMDRVTQSNAAGAEESASAAVELSAQANTVKKEVDNLAWIVCGKSVTVRRTF